MNIKDKIIFDKIRVILEDAQKDDSKFAFVLQLNNSVMAGAITEKYEQKDAFAGACVGIMKQLNIPIHSIDISNKDSN